MGDKEKIIKEEIKNFNAEADVEKLPYHEDYYFIRQGKRIIWMKENDRYCSARYYASEETAEETMELLRGKTDKVDIEIWKHK